MSAFVLFAALAASAAPAPLPAAARQPVPVAITIDDGCPDGLDVVAPRLEKHGWRGCFNVIAQVTTETRGNFLSWGDIRELKRRGHEIMTHATGVADSGEPVLANGATNPVLKEMVESCDMIERATGVRPKVLCPHGNQVNANGLRLMELAGLRAMRIDRPDHGSGTVAGTPTGVGAWLDKRLAEDPDSMVLMIHAAKKDCGYNPFRSLDDFDDYLEEIADRERRGLIKVVRYAEAEPHDRPAIASTPRWQLVARDAAGAARAFDSKDFRHTCVTNGPNMWCSWKIPVVGDKAPDARFEVTLVYVSTASGGYRVWGWVSNVTAGCLATGFDGPFVDEDAGAARTLRRHAFSLDAKARHWQLPGFQCKKRAGKDETKQD